ncbi:MAG: NAD-dependent epimerase/dehydratase family protein [Oscillochloridaceae bacterium umkhey_bin13]
MVYTSSSGVLGRRPDGLPADEQTPPDELVQRNLYFRSKLEAERVVDQFLSTHDLPVVLIQPGWMFGPNDQAPTSSGQLILDLLNRRIPVRFPGYGAPVDARDVAAAMITAAERGRSGERYIVGSATVIPFDQLFAMGEELSGVPVPRLPAPYWAALGVAYLSEAVGRLTGKPVAAPVEDVHSLRHPQPLNSAKAVRELGASFRPFRETLRDELIWFAQHRPALTGTAQARLLALAPAG